MSKRQLSDEFYREIEKLKPRYPTRQAILLPALHAAQDEKGWLSPEVMDEIAATLEIPPGAVREVATFYAMFNTKPGGRHHLRFCTNISCCLRGGMEMMHHAEHKLGIKHGETTPDGRFTIHEEECLGACGTAPAVMVDKDYHENLTKEKLDKLLDELK